MSLNKAALPPADEDTGLPKVDDAGGLLLGDDTVVQWGTTVAQQT